MTNPQTTSTGGGMSEIKCPYPFVYNTGDCCGHTPCTRKAFQIMQENEPKTAKQVMEESIKSQPTRADEREETQDAAQSLGANDHPCHVQHGNLPPTCADIQTVREALKLALDGYPKDSAGEAVYNKALSALERIENRIRH